MPTENIVQYAELILFGTKRIAFFFPSSCNFPPWLSFLYVGQMHTLGLPQANVCPLAGGGIAISVNAFMSLVTCHQAEF